ncbi:MAG: DNA polymerase III subunit gamma/tau, partial [Lactobacillus johnsonii]|nr:DNA polymerase III subunit gamma/tau [Lactobacillus johnsonii]
MAYQALYRKWRPRTFDGVVGQTAITDTLKNAIKRGKISHAFLFAGPRGTGKTSCAKIFAKALNCTNLQDGEPCNECENCLAADQGTMNDIIEIDAASNNGVDEIRDIRDKVKYAPTQGKYKVYIIDEVHMLSMGAFNALLKTLEEPPEHVVFILATTELQKVPATIISRTQRYNFKRIDQHDLIARMTYILGQEKIDFEEKALEVIAQVADGGMRDSLSILDQILSYDQDKVKYEDALRITGYAAQEKIEQVLLNLLNGETSAALEIVHALLQDGASTKNILDELISLTVKGMLAIKSNKEETFLTENYASELAKIPEEKFYSLVQAANKALNDLRYTNQQQIPLDVFVVQVTQAPVKADSTPQQADAISSDVVQTLKNQIDTLSKQVAELKNRPAPARSTTSDFSGTIKTETKSQIKRRNEQENKPEQKPKRRKASSNNQAAQENNRRQVYHVLENATKEDLNTVKDIWPDLLPTLKVSQR